MESRLHLVFRSYGGENTKNRPAWYSKQLALASFVRAARRVPTAEVIFLNDGPIPPDLLELMQSAGRIISIPDGPVGMRGSYWRAVTLPRKHPDWPDHDILSLNEDDYLFRADAFRLLEAAAAGVPQASYFSLYGTRPDYSDSRAREEFSLPRTWAPEGDQVVGGRVWFNQPSITSTFSGRVGAFRKDAAVFAHCMIPFRRRFLDHETCLLYQGVVPYHGSDILCGLPNDYVPGVRGMVRTAVLVPFRLALNAHAVARRRSRHLLYCLTPNMATHMEHPVISPDHDWTEEAMDVADWARSQGLARMAKSIERGRCAQESCR